MFVIPLLPPIMDNIKLMGINTLTSKIVIKNYCTERTFKECLQPYALEKSKMPSFAARLDLNLAVLPPHPMTFD